MSQVVLWSVVSAAAGWGCPVPYRGRQLCTINVVVTDPTGKLCATGRVLYALRAAQGKRDA